MLHIFHILIVYYNISDNFYENLGIFQYIVSNNKHQNMNRIIKRNAEEMGADVEDTVERKKKCVGIKDLVFLFFTAASCGLCQGCDLCHPQVCEPEEANAIRTKAGIIYKQVGRGFDLTFASLTCLFIRMRASFKYYGTPTAKPDHNGRLIVQITDDNGHLMGSQALKFASLAWGQVIADCILPDNFRDFGNDFHVHHGDGDKTNNNVSNGMLMTRPQHQAKTTRSAETTATAAMSRSAPCTMTVFVSKGKPLLDSERNPIVENYPHRKKVMIDYKLTSTKIADSIKYEDMPTRNSLVKIKYNGQACLAQFSWYNVPDLVDDDGKVEIWKPITKDDHDTMGVKMSETYEYFVSDMSRFKFVTKSTQNARIRDFRGQERPQFILMGKPLLFHRVIALVFHRKQMNKYIAEQYLKTGIVWTFVKGDYQLDVDHIDFNPENHCANNLQFLTPQENIERSHSRPCRIWEIGKDDAKKKYPSVAAAADDIGYSPPTVLYAILKNNTHEKWRGEYIVE